LRYLRKLADDAKNHDLERSSTDTFRSVMLTGACLGKFELLLQRG